MVQEDTKPVDWDLLESKLLEKTTLEHEPFLALVESPADFIYSFNLKIGDKDYGFVRFKKWTHEQAGRVRLLPFYFKLASKKKLTEEEEKSFTAFKIEMVSDCLVDRQRFDLGDTLFVNYIYLMCAHVSGLDEDFTKSLEAFSNSDHGLNYGMLWFSMFGKTPSEVARLPESDVRVIYKWFEKYSEKVNQSVSVPK